MRDGLVRRVIDKWLKAGVLEEGQVRHPDTGTPQGGVISPLLANIYLHEVLDKWLEGVVKPRLRGGGTLIRYADDLVLVFRNEADARRVLAVLPKRFGKYGLRLHPEKTRLLRFTPARLRKGESRAEAGPRSFDFLGFTHYWCWSRRGYWVVRQTTARNRFSRSLKRLSQWLRAHRHQPVSWQHRRLVRKLLGHAAYYGLRGNARALARFRYRVTLLWWKWLRRRSHRARLSWPRFQLLLQRYPMPTLSISASAT